MSYIDCYDHEYIGHLGYLPIYHPLEEIKGEAWGGYDFSATPKDLVLGGGCGEHPGLVVHKLESLAAKFLYDQITEKEAASLPQEERDYVVDLCHMDNLFEFCGWSVRHYAALTKMASSDAFMAPLGEDEAVEEWLGKSLGELVCYSLEELNPEHNRLVRIFSDFPIRATMRNVLCPPPGYPTVGGRRLEEGNVKWGLHRWSALT